MTGGLAAAYRVAGGLLWHEPWLWGLPLVVETPVWLTLLVTVRTIVEGELTPVELRRAAVLVALLLAVAAVVLTVVEAAWLGVVDARLADRRPGWQDGLDGIQRLTGPLLAGRLVLLLGSLTLAVLALALLLFLLCAGRWDHLLTLGTGGVAALTAQWRAAGPLWLAGMVVALAGVGAAREVLRLATVYWRPALLAAERPSWQAGRQAVEFVSARRGLLLGRLFWRLGVGLLALWTALLLTSPGRRWALLPGQAAVGRVAVGATVLVLLGAAVGVKAYLMLADHVYYRLEGGAGAEARWRTRAVRPTRPRRRSRRPWTPPVTVASEPAPAAAVGRPASEPFGTPK